MIDEITGPMSLEQIRQQFNKVACALNALEAGQPAYNSRVMKLPDFETVNDARLSSKDPMLEDVTKRQLRAVYDIISRQLS